MSRDPAKDVLKNPVDLPQIRLPIRGTKNADELAAERDDIEKLTKIVEDAFAAI